MTEVEREDYLKLNSYIKSTRRHDKVFFPSNEHTGNKVALVKLAVTY